MSVNASDANNSDPLEPNLDDDAAWLVRLNEVFIAWTAWATNSNARRSACFRQMLADRWIELTLAKHVLDAARTAGATSRAAHARQARVWTLRCVERMTSSVAQTRGMEPWMQDGLCFQSANRASDDVQSV